MQRGIQRDRVIKSHLLFAVSLIIEQLLIDKALGAGMAIERTDCCCLLDRS